MLRDAQIVEEAVPRQGLWWGWLVLHCSDVRAKLMTGTEVIIEIQDSQAAAFLNQFHYYLANQLVENVQNCASKMYEQMEPV